MFFCHWSSPRSSRLLVASISQYNGRFIRGSRFSSRSFVSKRRLAELEEDLKKALATIEDPVLHTDLFSLGWTPKRLVVPSSSSSSSSSSSDSLEIQIQVPTPLHPNAKELRQEIRDKVSALLSISFETNKEWEIVWKPVVPHPAQMSSASSQEYDEYVQSLGPGLSRVGHCIAVYSGKGGVGKSTVAVNLALELSRLVVDHSAAAVAPRVGLLDVDVYGPSLPVLVRPSDLAVKQSTRGRGMVHPISYHNVVLLSLGFVSPNAGLHGNHDAAVMRGPLASRVVTQLLKGTEWGNLDVLVLDLPPGTGDVPLGVCQDVQLSGAVVVTTPSKLSEPDVQKGTSMMTSLGVPTLAIVQNMSYFVCPGSNAKHYPFGRGVLAEENNATTTPLFEWPISTVTNQGNDDGLPIALSRPTEAQEELGVLEDLAKSIARDLLLIQYKKAMTASSSSSMEDRRLLSLRVVFPHHDNPNEAFDVASSHLSWKKDSNNLTVRFFSEHGALQIELDPNRLLERDPKTGEYQQKDEPSSMVTTTTTMQKKPTRVERKGHYGYAVHWSDGSTIIYSMLCLAKSAGGAEKEDD